MGVIYKLRPEVKDFLLKQKETDPALGCRKLSLLINEKFQIKLSKSHVNEIIRIQGLSNRVGRPVKPKKGVFEGSGLGAYMLKATDALAGGVSAISGALKEHLPEQADPFMLTEAMLYASLFGNDIKAGSDLWKLLRKSPSDFASFSTHLNTLQSVKTKDIPFYQAINTLFQEVLFLKIILSDGSYFSLDGQLHTLWSSETIPYQFSTTYCYIKSYINKFINNEEPVVLLMAPGYDSIPEKWFDLLSKCNSADIKIVQIDFMGPKSEKIDSLTFTPAKSCNIIFGLWPWQYASLRKAESLPTAEKSTFYFKHAKRELYLSESSIKLLQPNVNKEVRLRGIVVKNSPETSSVEFFITTNLPLEKASSDEVARLYLSRWANFKTGFEEFSRVVEVFTYNASFRQAFPSKALVSSIAGSEALKGALEAYQEALDAYFRWYFLPREYRQADFSTTKSRFYGLRAKSRRQKDTLSVTFSLPKGYLYRKDLEYAVERLNERTIVLDDGSRLWFAL